MFWFKLIKLVSKLIDERYYTVVDHIRNKFGDKILDECEPNIQELFKERENENLTQNSTQYYICSDLMGTADIIFVDTSELFLEMLEYFEQTKPNLLGFDCEWKPTDEVLQYELPVHERDQLSIFQIATRDKVFIVDVLRLVASLRKNSKKNSKKFGDLVLFSEQTVKL